MKQEHSAGIIIFYDNEIENKKERLYLTLCYHKNYWGLAKGRLERNEKEEQAAKREALEETGLDVEILPGFKELLSYFYKDKQRQLISKTVTYFVGQALTDQVVLSFEHIDYKWLPFEKVIKQITYEQDREMIIKAEKFLNQGK